MKIKRKLYPNSNDKDFILMSVNDLVKFGLNVHFEVSTGTSNEFAERVIKTLITETINTQGLKTPASHSKTKKVKEEIANV